MIAPHFRPFLMAKAICFLLLVANVHAYVIQGSPQLLTVINDKLQYWTKDWSYYMPDGKISAFRENRGDPQSDMIFNLEFNFRIRSNTSLLNDATAPAPVPPSPTGSNQKTIPNTIPIPPANKTGGRGDGTYLDWSSIWTNNMFRLCETSQPDAPSTSMIGFVHNEDYWGYPYAVHGKTYKSIGVRYSSDLGVTWTRSVPIITKLVQPPTDNIEMSPYPGTGDQATIWNPLNNTWVNFAWEGDFAPYQNPALVMSTASHPLAIPGNWTRIQPGSGKTDPGLIGANRTLNHPDLSSIKGSNPSIIRDDKNKVWHMVWGQWGGGIAYTNSTDLWRWQTPTFLPLSGSHPGSTYPSLIGDMGDALTTDGTAMLYFKDDTKTSQYGRSLWAVGINFNVNSTTTAQEGGVIDKEHVEQSGLRVQEDLSGELRK